MNSDDSSPNKQFRFLRIVHSIFLASIPIFLLVIIFYLKLGMGLILHEAFLIHLMEIAFGIITVIILLRVHFWRKYSSIFRTFLAESVVSFHFLRTITLESIAIYGLVLAILGSQWYIWIWFFVVSAAALVLTFPTDERVSNWTQNQSKP